jgi:hypothetical protein
LVLDDVAARADMQFHMNDTVFVCAFEVPLGCQCEVVWRSQQTEHGKIPDQEIVEVVEPIPVVDAIDVVSRWRNPMSFTKGKHGRGIHGSFQVNVQFGLRQRPGEFERKRFGHLSTLPHPDPGVRVLGFVRGVIAKRSAALKG